MTSGQLVIYLKHHKKGEEKMKIYIGAYQLDIKSIRSDKNKDENKEDLMYFLNELSLVYGYAADHNFSRGYQAHAKDYREKANTLYDYLNDLEVYG